MGEYTRADAAEKIKDRGLSYEPAGFRLASTAISHWYCDVKAAVGTGSDLTNVSRLAIDVVRYELGVEFDYVGGPTMGADPFAHGIAIEATRVDKPFVCAWFSVRKDIDEDRAAQHTPPVSPPRFPPVIPEEWFWIEGRPPGANNRVLWIEDAVSTGDSVLRAMNHYNRHPIARLAPIVGALAIVDRGDAAAQIFDDMHIPYASLVTYRDLGIPAIGQE